MMVGDEDLKMSLLVMIKDNHCQFRCSYCPMERECTTQEFKDFEINVESERTTWNAKGVAPTEIDFADAEIELIKKQLKQMDDSNKLTFELFSIYEKFC